VAPSDPGPGPGPDAGPGSAASFLRRPAKPIPTVNISASTGSCGVPLSPFDLTEHGMGSAAFTRSLPKSSGESAADIRMDVTMRSPWACVGVCEVCVCLCIYTYVCVDACMRKRMRVCAS
jgi:hypothetical protein